MGKRNLLFKRLLSLLATTALLVCFSITGWGQAVAVDTYNSTGTFVWPSGVTSITVEVWGAGGAGGNSTANGIRAAGGGGGGYSKKVITEGSGSYTVTVGVGGSNGADGGVSWFGASTTVLANGGKGVAANGLAGGDGAGVGAGDLTFTGGSGAGGANGSGTAGGGGSSAGTGANGVNGGSPFNYSGGVAPTGGGDGGNGAATASNAGGSPSIGSLPGGGGGGAWRQGTSQNGGSGANGKVVITYLIDCSDVTIKLSSAAGTDDQTKCINTAITNITYDVGDGATGADVTDLPNGVTGSYNAGVFTISGIPTESGPFNYTVTTTGQNTACTAATATGTIEVNPASVAGTAEADDDYVCDGESTTITLTGYTGAIQWQESADGVNGWIDVATGLGDETDEYTTADLTVTTFFRAMVKSGVCSAVYSNVIEVGVDSEGPEIELADTDVVECGDEVTVETNVGDCTYTAGDEFDVEVEDNFTAEGDIILTWELTGDTEDSGVGSSLSGVIFNQGITTVTFKAEDDCENTTICSFDVKVKLGTSTSAYTSAESTRWMDYITLYAIVDGGPCDGCDLEGEVDFYIGPTMVGTAEIFPVPEGEDNFGSMRATLIYKVVDVWPSKTPYTVTAEFKPAYDCYAESEDETTLKIHPRKAKRYNANLSFYTGDTFGWITSKNSNTATVTLAATLMDDSDPTGDVRGAKVTFNYNNNGVLTPIPGATNLPVGLIDQLNSTVGFASADVQFNISKNSDGESFDIVVTITRGYYSEPAEGSAIVTIARTLANGSILGSGTVTNENSAGLIKGAATEGTDFSFNVKYNKKATNAQGYFSMTFESHYNSQGILDGHIHTYFVKSNAINSFVVGPLTSGETTIGANQAIFEAKANIAEWMQVDLLDDEPVYGFVGIEGNSPLRVTLTDDDVNGDMVGITYFRADGGIWFSNNWDAGNMITLEQPVSGTIVVASSGSIDKLSQKSLTGAFFGEGSELSVYPNPFRDKLYFDLVWSNNADARLEMFDMRGAKVATVFNSRVEAGQFYRLDYTPVNVPTGMLMYRLTIDGEVTHGKVLFKQ
jgi:hypothetical protein